MILVADIGTTAVKVSLYGDDLHPIEKKITEYRLLTGENGIVEFDAEEYWTALLQTVAKLDVSLDDVRGICVTTQGETLIPVDKDGNALHRAIVWLDARAEQEAAQIAPLVPDFYRKTGVPECNGLCPIAKLLWFKNKRPEIYARTAYFLLLEDYLLWKLTSRFVTEKSLLTTTGYFDLQQDRVWTELLEQLGLDCHKIPIVLDCGEIVGPTTEYATHALGLSVPATVVTGAMDQTAAAVGAGNLQPGILTETTGTAMCIGATLPAAPLQKDSAVPIYRHYAADRYLALPVCMTAGIVLKWFKDEFCREESLEAEQNGTSVYDRLNQYAQSAQPLCGGLTLLPYFAGSMQPDAFPAAKGAFVGVTLDTAKADFVRAIMEGVAYMLRENIELLKDEYGLRPTEIRSMGGGAKSDVWNRIKATVTQLPIALMEDEECTSAGAAILCAVALKQYADVEHAAAQTARIRTHVWPKPSQAYEEGYRRYHQLYDALKPFWDSASTKKE